MDFTGYRTILMETFKRDSSAVNTPVWFVQEGDTLYFRTAREAAKARRLRNQPRARIAGADASENPATAWIEVTARFLDGEEAARMYDALDKRYSGAFRRFDGGTVDGIVVIALDLPPET